jgi:hypothetical protein
MSTHQTQFDNANAAAAFVASLNAISYFNYEKILDVKNSSSNFQQKYQTVRSINNSNPETNPFLFPSSQTAAIALAAAASSPFHQQFQQHFTQQFQNHISQLRQEATTSNSSPTYASTRSNNMAMNSNKNQSKHPTAALKILDESELPKDDSKCHACGDKSTGSHFGGISCESCKAFFRRSVQKNRWEEYKCSYKSECKMNTNTRKICQYCRYNMCLSIGMRPKWVLSDDERQQKYGSRRKKNKLVAAAAAAAINIKEEDENETPESLEEKFYKYGVEAINEQSKMLKNYDQVIINKLTYAFYYSRQAHDLNLSSIDIKFQQLLRLNTDSAERTTELSKLSKLILANFMVQPVKRVITFAKLLPDFRNLAIDDQMALLRGSTMEIFICSSQNLFDKTTNSFTNVISRERNIPTGSNDDSNSIQLDILRFIWSDEVFDKTISYLKSMNDLDIDETTLILYIPLILFSPDRRELINRERILKIQNKYSSLLYKYLYFKYDKQVDVVNKIFTKLLLKMIDLRDLHELHSSILLDVADSSELELYSEAIIRDNKNESDKINGIYQNGNKRLKVESFNDSDSDCPMNSFSTFGTSSRTSSC